jgi:glycosyltransferase involved in cell wall biosynthesis
LTDKVNIVGWVRHEQLPDYLNKMKLIVMPSLTEGLPNVMLEAMACGTPILATPVGAIKDIIADGSNGFIIQENLPEKIAQDVNTILTSKKMELVSQNAMNMVKTDYSFDAAVTRYQIILDSIK